MTQRALLPFLSAICLAACASTEAPRGSEDYVTELLEASMRRPEPVQRVGERQPPRMRSRGLANADLPTVVVELAVNLLDESGAVLSSQPARLALVRFPDLVHLSAPDGGDEWLFHRNRVARDEVSGERADHASHFVIDYTDSELAAENVLDGWARLAQLFVAPEELDRLAPTGERTHFAGHDFERRVRAGEAAEGEVVEVEWSETLGLPRRIVWRARQGLRAQELVALRPATQADRPAAFAARWPDYDRKDLSDWREDVHGHVEGHDHATH
ncbi:MAG TPA: hypothetical protein VMT18_10330 [Planctomycetota bacterium]|nr:hypothetical protein [Planctomycetota bacterium]